MYKLYDDKDCKTPSALLQLGEMYMFMRELMREYVIMHLYMLVYLHISKMTVWYSKHTVKSKRSKQSCKAWVKCVSPDQCE